MKVTAALHEDGPLATLEAIQLAEACGVPGVWLTSSSGDQLTLFAAATQITRDIELGAAVVPIFTRHPVTLAEQAGILARLAPGRIRLGIGPSHALQTEDWLGLHYLQPLSHLREVVHILKMAFDRGQIDFQGQHYQVRFPFATVCGLPILVSALRERAFSMAGELSDGAIAWICPPDYLREVAVPAMERGARRAGRPTPPLLGHLFLSVTDDPEAARLAGRERLATYPRLPNYSRMLEDAGLPSGGEVTSELLKAVLVCGSPQECRRGLEEFRERSGASELICSMLPVGRDRAEGLRRCLELVGSMAGQVEACP